MIYPVTIVTEAYSCAYVGNICPILDLVLLLDWLASVCLSGTEGFTYGCCSSEGCCIGDLWVSHFCPGGTAACYYGSGEFSLVMRP